MHKKLTDMNPVDDFVTQNTPGLKIWDENWGGMQCAYHIFAPGTDFTDILKGKGLEHDLCGVEHWAYVLKGTLEVIYLDGTIDVCRAGECCFWPAPHNFKSKEGAEILQFSTAGGLAAQGKRVQEFVAKQEGMRRALSKSNVGARCSARRSLGNKPTKNEREKQNETENRCGSHELGELQKHPRPPLPRDGGLCRHREDAEGPRLYGGIDPRRPRGLQEDRSQEAGGRTRRGHVRGQPRTLLDDGRNQVLRRRNAELPRCRVALGRGHDRGRDDLPVRRAPTCPR